MIQIPFTAHRVLLITLRKALRARLCSAGAFVVLVLLALAIGSAPCLAQTNILSDTFGPKSKSQFVVTSAFQNLPASGYAPLMVEIVNKTPRKTSWTMKCESTGDRWGMREGGGFTSSFNMSVEAGKTGRFEFMVPLRTAFETRTGYGDAKQYLKVDLSCQLGTWSGGHGSSIADAWPMIGYSSDLSQANSNDLTDEYRKATSGSSPGGYPSEAEFGSIFAADSAPSDWRGYSGFDALMITSKEWIGLKPASRNAVLEWNRLGGKLILFTDDASQTLKSLKILPQTETERVNMRSLGRIELRMWDGKDIEAKKTVRDFSARASATQLKSLGDDYTNPWRLREEIGETGGSPVFIVLILIAFGITVGPVNLFAWAGPGKRHRLFITTPLISLATSLILGAIIIFQDGFGGAGSRLVVINLESGSGENKAYITQEQICRTGVVFANSFETESPMFISQIAISPKYQPTNSGGAFGRTPSGRKIGTQGQYQMTGQEYDGDWFKSRAIQGQLIKCVKSTRARVELASGAGSASPILFSSLGFDVKTIYYIVPNGGVFKGHDLETGDKKSLKRSSLEDLKGTLDDRGLKSSGLLKDRIIDAIDRGRSMFIAFGNEAGDLPVETMGSVDWDHNHIIVFGSIEAGAEQGGPAGNGN